jgi:hypothetical protein
VRATTEAPVEQAAQPAPDAKPAPEDPKSTDDTDWKAEARKWEQRAKDNKRRCQGAGKAAARRP